MNAQQLLNEILPILYAVKEDPVKLQDKLINALNRKRPFANFKFIIDSSPYRREWFGFKKQWMEDHVKELLMSELQENDTENE